MSTPSFRNPFADELKLDQAREHWETHVLIRDDGMHEAHMKAKADKAMRTIEQQHDYEFGRWLDGKTTRGFANFTLDLFSDR
jgi:hypothetical protein